MRTVFKSCVMSGLMALGMMVPVHAAGAEAGVSAMVSACFTPEERCEGRIVGEIDRAKASIHVQAYGFTSAPIEGALERARTRGVEVFVILDKVNERKDSKAALLVEAGIPVFIDFEPAIAHGKIIIIDGRMTIGGSYNYTAAAGRRNAENVTFMEGESAAALFMANWNARLKRSRPFSKGE